LKGKVVVINSQLEKKEEGLRSKKESDPFSRFSHQTSDLRSFNESEFVSIRKTEMQEKIEKGRLEKFVPDILLITGFIFNVLFRSLQALSQSQT
jgi:hypothetical protein